MVYSSEKLLAQVLISTAVTFAVFISIVRFLNPQLEVNPVIILLTTSFSLFISYYHWIYQYWSRKNLPHLENQIFFPKLINGKHTSIELAQLYRKMKQKGWKHGGVLMFLLPAYAIVDLELIKNVMTKDFDYFTDRGIFYDETTDPLSAHLFNLGGTKWKILRKKFSSFFTSSKVKISFQTLLDCEFNLIKQIELEHEKKAPINIKKLAARYIINVVGSCFFGLDCKTFSTEESLFVINGQKLIDRSASRKFKRLIANTFPNIGKLFKIKEMDPEVTNFYSKLIIDAVNYRRENNITRNDFLQKLMDLKNEDGEAALSIIEIAVQSFIFFVAGYETSASSIAFAIYELAKNQEIQNKVRSEILRNHKLTYEAIKEMKYLSQVVNETFRKYPTGSFLTRKCVKDYKIPDIDVVIEKGTPVLIPVLGIHYDEEYYPDPEKFDPDRFINENVKTRHPYAFLPFGEGPRICIGKNFALIEVKVGLVCLLRKFRFTVNPKTSEPLEMKKDALIPAVVGEIWLDAYKL